MYEHLTLEELKEDLMRMEESHKNGEDHFSEERFNVELEIKNRSDKK